MRGTASVPQTVTFWSLLEVNGTIWGTDRLTDRRTDGSTERQRDALENGTCLPLVTVAGNYNAILLL